jgi:hypothetical protein
MLDIRYELAKRRGEKPRGVGRHAHRTTTSEVDIRSNQPRGWFASITNNLGVIEASCQPLTLPDPVRVGVVKACHPSSDVECVLEIGFGRGRDRPDTSSRSALLGRGGASAPASGTPDHHTPIA